MKIEIDTQKDTKEDIKKVIMLLETIISTKNDVCIENEVASKDIIEKNKSVTPDIELPSKEALDAYKKGKKIPFQDDVVVLNHIKKENYKNNSKKENDEPKIEVY